MGLKANLLYLQEILQLHRHKLLRRKKGCLVANLQERVLFLGRLILIKRQQAEIFLVRAEGLYLELEVLFSREGHLRTFLRTKTVYFLLLAPRLNKISRNRVRKMMMSLYRLSSRLILVSQRANTTMFSQMFFLSRLL